MKIDTGAIKAKIQSSLASEGVIAEAFDVSVFDGMADDLRSMIIGAGGGLPSSLNGSLQSLGGSGGYTTTTSGNVISYDYSGELSFGDLGWRASWGGAGAAPMLMLFNGGWSASSHAYGMWGGERVPSRTFFEGLHFVEAGATAFENKYLEYDAHVTIDGGW